MYSNIAEYYSQIFPLDPDRVSFIRSHFNMEAPKLLDIGCSSGDSAISLAEHGCTVTGIDTDGNMIKTARLKKQTQDGNPDFKVMDMLDIGSLPEFDGIVCFGNTLPHLSSQKLVLKFFKLVWQRLVKGGFFIFQILNYDKIMRNRTSHFPVIENENFCFKRFYTFSHAGNISFNIEFNDKKNRKSYQDQTILLPLLQDELIKYLTSSGFSDINIYADYSKNKNDLKEYASLYTVKK